ncbi:MAG TPA: hypothetical protein VFK35_02580 [Candidatus Limnocylindrales bacterium]|nr:hypothetical protein [Candidatus Limnocylindrales bacterium]
MKLSIAGHRGRLARGMALAVPMALVAAAQLPAAALGAPPPIDLFDRNLIVNGDAEQGAGSPSSVGGVVPVPGWTTSSGFTAVQYELQAGVPDSFPTPDDSVPADHGTNLFVGGPANDQSDATQLIHLAAAAKVVDSGLVTYSLSGWLGGFAGQEDNAIVSVSFRRANGQETGAAAIGPVTATDRADATGLHPRATFGAVPSGTRQALVRITMAKDPDIGTYNDGYADNVALRLTSLFGSNLIVNGDAEMGASSPDGFDVLAVPGWSTDGSLTAARYGGDELPAATDPGPSNRGTALFSGGPATAFSSASQTIDVSAGARLIDTGLVPFTLAGYLGGWTDQADVAEVTIEFRSSVALIGSAAIGPVTREDRNDATGLLQRRSRGVVPAGTRSIVVILEMTKDPSVGTYNDGYADDLRLVLGT